MALAADRFLERLERDALAPAYFLYGDEPLQLSECTDALRRAARAAGLSERLVFDADSASDWERIRGESSAMSLFAERRLIEVRIGSRKPDKGGQAVIGDILAGGSDDVFLFTSGALDGRQRKAQWFKLLEKGTVCVATRDLPAAQLPGWLSRRAARFDKRLSGDAAELIAERVEGNLLAAAQEVEKLCLLVDADALDARSVIAAVSDSARYD
ncbi:MAG: DNA polymerase III subunit delta, partial [Gammaproteobacteria bacterium]